MTEPLPPAILGIVAVEEFIEGLPRDPGDADPVDRACLRVAALGDDLDHRLVDAVALGLGHRLPRQAVPSAGQPLAELGRASAGSHAQTVVQRCEGDRGLGIDPDRLGAVRSDSHQADRNLDEIGDVGEVVAGRLR